MFIKHEKVPAGTVMWSEANPPTYCFFLISGELNYRTPADYHKKRKIWMTPGCIFGDFPCLSGESLCKSEIKAISEVEILSIKKEDWLIFLGKNPGLMLVFKEEYNMS